MPNPNSNPNPNPGGPPEWRAVAYSTGWPKKFGTIFVSLKFIK